MALKKPDVTSKKASTEDEVKSTAVEKEKPVATPEQKEESVETPPEKKDEPTETPPEQKAEQPEASVSPSSLKPLELEEEPEVADVTQPTEEQEAAKEEGKMAKVKNKGKSFLYQASSGLYIQEGEVKSLLDDSWLGLQIKVGLLERV